MGVSLYARIFDNRLRGVKPTSVELGQRTFDGIERPDYSTISILSPDDARYLAQQLFEAAEKIDGKSKKDRTAAKIKKNTEQIAKRAKEEAMNG